MASQITHIRLSENYATSTDKITHVKLSGGTIETVAQVVRYLDLNLDYYYTADSRSKTYVEAVHSFSKDPYIRTKANSTTKDNLLNLPTF